VGVNLAATVDALTSRPPAVSTKIWRPPWFVRGCSVGIIFLGGACGAEDMSRSTLLLSLVTANCYTDVQDNATALFPKDSDSSGATSWATTTGIDTNAASETPATTHDPLPTTPGSSDPWTMTTGEPENQPPEILQFEIKPDMLNEAGTAHAFAAFNEHVTKLVLKVNGVVTLVGAPSEFEWSFTATSKAKSDGIYLLELTARDDEDQTDVATATLKVDLPGTGDPRCMFEEAADDGWFAGVVYGDALVLAGTLGWPTQAAVWRLDPDSCKPQFGSPWKISQWTGKDLPGPSQAVGLAIDAEGRTAIAANVGTIPDRLSYIAVLSPEGSLAWEQLGETEGRIYNGVTASPEGFFVVGETQWIDKNVLRSDGFIEGFDDDGASLWTRPIAAPLPGDDWSDDLNIFDEHPRALVWSDALQVLVVVGERFIFENNNDTRLRSFTLQYTLEGEREAAWTSSGLDSLDDGLATVTICADELVAAGWIKNGGSLPTPATRWLDASGNGAAKRRLDMLEDTTFYGLACDSETKFTAAATVKNSLSARAIEFQLSDDPFVYNELFPSASLTAADCDPRGFCAVAGALGNRPWVRVHHP
jgi:hypothetical protein